MGAEYYGHNLTRLDYEVLAIARIPQRARSREADLFQTKWFDYREMHPTQATYLFASIYSGVVRDLYAQTKDRDAAENVKAFRPDDVFQSRELVAFWIARQKIDAVGARYGFALNFMMRRFVHERHWHVFPRPNQLYGDEAMLDLRDAWKVHCASILEIAKAPQYRGAEGESAGAIAYRTWIVEQIKGRAHPQMPLSSVLQNEHLTRQQATAIFGSEIVKKAVELIP